MKFNPLTFSAIEAAAMGAGATFAASALSFSISGITLFAAAPFIPDSAEAAIGRWMSQSAITAGASGAMNVLCWQLLFESSGLNRRKDDEDDSELEPLPPVPDFSAIHDEVFGKPPAFETPLICLDCQFLNQDFSTRSLLLCGVRSCPPQDNFCPDKQVPEGIEND